MSAPGRLPVAGPRSQPRERLSLDACRRALGNSSSNLSDAQLGKLRDQLYAFAEFGVDAYVRSSSLTPQEDGLVHIPDDDRYDVEERAAVLQFDAGMTRSAATRTAIASHRRAGKQANRGSNR